MGEHGVGWENMENMGNMEKMEIYNLYLRLENIILGQLPIGEHQASPVEARIFTLIGFACQGSVWYFRIIIYMYASEAH